MTALRKQRSRLIATTDCTYWPEKARTILAEEWAKGTTHPEIAAILCRSGWKATKGSVSARAHRMGLPRRLGDPDRKPARPKGHTFFWPPVAVSLLERLWAEGKPAAEIAQAITNAGWPATKAAVVAKADRLNLPPHPGHNGGGWSGPRITRHSPAIDRFGAALRKARKRFKDDPRALMRGAAR